MKNIQVIDGAINCVYSIYQVEDWAFQKIFPEPGQNIEFIENVAERMSSDELSRMMAPIWRNRVEKKDAQGIHGTLFYGLEEKKRVYPSKRESDADLPFQI